MCKVPLASIIISSYNYARFLGDAIESAIYQTYPNTEVIVVDDGSTDGSQEVIASYGAQIVSLMKENGGQASALNSGFSASQGAFVFFLDSDDTLLPTAVEKAINQFDRASVVKVHWHLLEVDKFGQKTGGLVPNYSLADGDLREDRIRTGVTTHDWPPTSGNAWARWFLEKVFPIPEDPYKTCPDIYLAVLAPIFGEVRRMLEPQACYRLHGNNNLQNISRLEEFARWDETLDLLAAYLQRMGVRADAAAWKKHSWLHRRNNAIAEISEIIVHEKRFILVDGDDWGADDIIVGHRPIPFLEREGKYWGTPSDDATAIRELERLREAGADFIVFAWPAFWWFDYYAVFNGFLRSRFPCELENERVVVFRLNSGV